MLREIVFPHHPAFQNPQVQTFALANPEVYNIERLIELTLAHVGGMKFVDEVGYDFLPDYSDSKTVSVNKDSYKAEFSGVENKIGALRVTVYNPITDTVAFFFLPKRQVRAVKRDCYGVNSHKERIVFSYSRVHSDSYGYFDDYRVTTFRELARAR